MTRMLLLALAAAAFTAFAAPPALALSPLQKSVARDLRSYGFGEVDVRDLSVTQLAEIHHITSSAKREGEKRAKIRSALGGRYSLTGGLRLEF